MKRGLDMWVEVVAATSGSSGGGRYPGLSARRRQVPWAFSAACSDFQAVQHASVNAQRAAISVFAGAIRPHNPSACRRCSSHVLHRHMAAEHPLKQVGVRQHAGCCGRGLALPHPAALPLKGSMHGVVAFKKYLRATREEQGPLSGSGSGSTA